MLQSFIQALVFIFLANIFFTQYFVYPGTLRMGINLIKEVAVNIFNTQTLKGLLSILFATLLFLNFSGNNPFSMVPTMLYSVTVSISLTIWLSLITTSLISAYFETVSHLLPFGTPIGLMVLLPLIEVLSQILRPFTLAIRLSTNLAAGHILVFIFSYFMVQLSTVGSVILGGVVLGLQGLELAISLLQAYIFCALLLMYTQEAEETLL